MMCSKKPNILILLLLTAFASVAAVLYTPALPSIMVFFKVSAGQAQLTMTAFIIAYALGPGLYGPLQHRFGRKPTLYRGMLVGVVGMLVCVLANYLHAFHLLIVGRFIEGLGTSVGLVVTLTIIYDVYQGAQMRRVLSLTALAFAFLPGLAIFMGGIIIEYFSWVGCFYFMIVYTGLLFLLSTRLPETSPGLDKNALKLKIIAARYANVFSDRVLIRYSLIWGTTTAVIYLFAAYAPLIVIKHFGFSPAMFGLINLSCFAGLIIGNLLSAYLAERITPRVAILLGIVLMALGFIPLAITVWLQCVTVQVFYSMIFICYIGIPLIIASSSALASGHVGAEEKATASAAISVINMGTAVMCLLVGSALGGEPLATLSILCGAMLVIVLLLSLGWILG